MITIEENLSAYCVGLAIYTYEDLLKRGRPLAVLTQRIRQIFPELDLDLAMVQHLETKLFQDADSDTLRSGLERGEFARFQIFSSPGSENQPSGLLRASLDAVRVDFNEPNYIFFSVPAVYYANEIESVHHRILTVGREALDILNGVYGFSHLGFLSLEDDGNLPPLKVPLAIPATDFRHLYLPTDLRNQIPYLFWANWLGRAHVERLGGQDFIENALPNARVDRMSRGALLITSYPTPLSRINEVSENDLDTLANFLIAYKVAESINSSVDSEDGSVTNYVALKPSDPDTLKQQISDALTQMSMHVQKFEQEYLQNNKAPRNYIWRPYRFCTQDVVLGLTVVRHSVDNNCLEVDVCLTTELPEFEDWSSARVMWSFLLSEAFKCGGTMEIRFTPHVEGGHVPNHLAAFARHAGVALNQKSDGRVTPAEARAVYLAITEFKPVLRNKILALANEGRLSPERACYAVHRGLWTQPELAQIIFGTTRADKILSGETPPEDRLLYRDNLLHARAALLGGFLDRKLMKRVRSEAEKVIDREDDVLTVDIDFDPILYAKSYICSEALHLPWLAPGQANSMTVNPSVPLVALIRARDREDLDLFLESDLALAKKSAADARFVSHGAVNGILVPRDFEDLPSERQKKLIRMAMDHEILILICPESTISLDTEAARRFTSSRIIRE